MYLSDLFIGGQGWFFSGEAGLGTTWNFGRSSSRDPFMSEEEFREQDGGTAIQAVRSGIDRLPPAHRSRWSTDSALCANAAYTT